MITLRPQQIAAADAVEAAYRRGVKRPLVDMCVASGKSYMFAELARRAVERGERMIIGAHVRELVEQNANACRLLMPGVHIGINAASLGERTWRAPVICAAIQSVHQNAASFGPVDNLAVDEAHLLPHTESGMYRALHRGLGYPRLVGGSGTVFRLQGGSLVEGDEPPFDEVVYRYTIADGIRDGYLCPAFSLGADDKMDVAKLRMRAGEYDTASQDAQMIDAMDNHIAQMVHHGWQTRKAWLIFEASTKAATLMAERMNAWGIPTGLVLGTTKADERAATVAAFRASRLRALVNVLALTTGFDVPQVDLLVFRMRTKSLGRYIQVAGRLLRTIGGNIEASIAAGKSDGAVLDFGGLIDEHGPLDFLRPKESKPSTCLCESCGKRNPSAAARCWSCDETMLKNCPACLTAIPKHEMTCPVCSHDMKREEGERKEQKLFDVPTGAALLKSYGKAEDRVGGWVAVRKCYAGPDGVIVDTETQRATLPVKLEAHGPLAKWVRFDGDAIVSMLIPNGSSRSSALQINSDGRPLIVPLPDYAREVAA